MAYLSRGDPSAALTVAETALIDDGNSPQFHHLKAKALAVRKRPIEAIAAYDRVLALAPGNVDAFPEREAVLDFLRRKATAH